MSKRSKKRGDKPKKYKATIEPQAWINDYAVAVDPPGETTWDCTAYVTDPENADYFGETFRKELDDQGYFLDRDDFLMDDPNAPEWVSEWQGPFTITVEEDDEA